VQPKPLACSAGTGRQTERHGHSNPTRQACVDLVVQLEKPFTKESVNAAMKKASETDMKGILGYCDEPLVSVDFKGDERSSILDSICTMAMGDDMLEGCIMV
jgi:glyceraldehyde-3-phosphate dehydrogenase/erythrose-4-phosphate dehydrogenase